MSKFVAKLLLLVIILTTCFTLVGCINIKIVPVWKKRNSEFKAIIMDMPGRDKLNFEISNSYDFRIAIFNEDINEETYKDIQFEYNKENMLIDYRYTRKDRIYFTIYPYELGSDNELKITYNGKTIKVNYNVVDYDFEKHGYEKISSIDALNKYPEIKDMILSIEYHEFEEPFVGLDDTWRFKEYKNNKGEKYSYYVRDCLCDKSNMNYISTDYLPYLTDSIYYPSRFDTVSENRVSSIEAYLYLPDNAETGSGADRTRMERFVIDYSVCDPCCTAEYPLLSMSFSATSIGPSENITDVGDKHPSQLDIWFERYPEMFFKYKLGDLTIYILCEKEEGASAYFCDDNYFYKISGYYDQEYK
jgi:hypothetical protein